MIYFTGQVWTHKLGKIGSLELQLGKPSTKNTQENKNPERLKLSKKNK